MNYIIREMHPNENPLLEDFLYQAIYQPDKTNLAPRSIIEKPELQVYIKDFGTKKDDYCFCAEADGKIVGAAAALIIIQSNLRFLFLTNIKKWVLAQR